MAGNPRGELPAGFRLFRRNIRRGEKMKKIIALLLGIVMLAGTVAQAEQVITYTEPEAREDTIGIQRGTSLTVGTRTAMGGHFGTDLFGDNTADMDVRSLIHGYSTVAWTTMLGLTIDGVVASIETREQPDGSRDYIVYLSDALTYSDGSQITSQDYVFSILLGGAPELSQLGVVPKSLSHLMGYDAYTMGESKSISGVRLLSDTSFSLHISAEYLPYFYGLAMLNVSPLPMSIIAPGCKVADDGNGVYITSGDNAGQLQGAGYTPGQFSAEMLRVTLLDEATGYEYNPTLTCGPYKLESYDKAQGVATFVINESYIGNYEGQRPHIERLTFKHVQNETMMGQLKNGELDLINKVTYGDAIAEGQALIAENGGAFQAGTYLRTGLSFLSFACELGPTQSAAVRRAIAMCFDRAAFVQQVVPLSGQRVYGYYGLGQWMATYTQEAGDGQEAINMPEQLAQLDLPVDVEQAKELLVADGWTLNESGAAYTEGTDAVRCRQTDTGLEPLVIRWAKTADSEIADALQQALMGPMAAIGMRLEVTELPFNELLTHYYRQSSRDYNMFFVASNFTYVFDPYYDFNTADRFQGMTNTTGLKDEQLMNLALDMRETTSVDIAGYVTKWLAFQQRFVEMMPLAPLYSSVYFDYYSSRLQGYDIASHSGWALAIPYAYIGEAAAQ